MNTLTTRELSCIQDHLNQEALVVKKFRSTAQQTTDPQLRNLYEHAANTHEKHFKMLMQHLNQTNLASTQAHVASPQTIQ
ncbi:MAG: spore coat protein [Clostridia bacterium]|nr:spore coat protein [Clostridia bacterium]